jgi:hypothetical protein
MLKEMKNIIRLLSLTIAVLFITFSTHATVYETIANGNWHSKSTWKNNQRPGTWVGSSNSIKISHDVILDKNVQIDCALTFYNDASISGSKNFSVNSSGIITGSNSSVNFSVADFNFYSAATLSASTFNINCSDDFSCSGNLTVSTGAIVNIAANDDIYLYNSSNFNGGNVTLTAGGKIAFSNNVTIKNSLTLNAPLYYFYNTLSITEGGSLLINNTSSTVYASNSVSIVNGSLVNYPYFVNYNNFSVETNGSLTTYGTLQVYNVFTNSGSTTIESSNDKTGNIIYSSKNGTSNLHVKRHLSADGWHYVSSPVHNSSSNVFHSAALYSYDETNGSWEAIGANETLTNMKGYDAYYKSQNRVVVFNGQMNDGDISINLSKTPGSSSNGFNLVGNPYPSAIDWNASAGWVKNNIDNAVYVWDDATQSITTYVNNIGTNGGSNIIPATMAFFVKCNSTSGGSLTVKNAARIPDYPQFRSENTNNTFKIKVSGNNFSDETAINFNDNATTTYDASFDAEKMYSYNPSVPQIYSLTEDLQEMAINSIPNPTINSSIPLNVFCPVSGEYTLSFDAGEFDQTYDVFIEDKRTGNVFDTKTGEYTFSANNTESNDRFLIHFVPVQGIANTELNTVSVNTESETAELTIWTVNQTLYISSEQVNEREIILYDVNGKRVFSEKTSSNSIDINQPGGVYIVKITEGTKMTSQKIMID